MWAGIALGGGVQGEVWRRYRELGGAAAKRGGDRDDGPKLVERLVLAASTTVLQYIAEK